MTILLTTQYLEEADRLADRIAVIDGGRVVAEGTADELKARIGGETVELCFADEDGLGAAARALDDWDGCSGRVELETLSVHVPTDGTAAGVKRVLDLMAGCGIPVDRVALHRPTLDEVFLTLTDRELEDAR